MNIKVAKIIVFILGCIPLTVLIGSLFANPTPDPYERIAHTTGEFAIRFLILTLLITPIKNTFNWKRLGAFRRTTGVLCFTYVIAHVFAYMLFESEFSPAYLIDDIIERRYILAGFLAFVMMVPLGLTSNNFSVGKLGKKWKKLHLLVFPLTFFACLHNILQVKGDHLTSAIVYFVLFGLACLYRIVMKIRKNKLSKNPT